MSVVEVHRLPSKIPIDVRRGFCIIRAFAKTRNNSRL